MGWLKQIFSRRRRYDEIAESIREHLEEKIEDLMEDGLSREEATRKAHREFGNVTLIEERSREVWRWPGLETLFQDLRYGGRLLSTNPGFTLIAIFTLALGIGANTMVFSLADACMLRPFNFPNQDRLVMIWEKGQAGFARGFVAPGNFNDWVEQSRSFERLVAIEQQPFYLKGLAYPERVNRCAVSIDFSDAAAPGARL